MVKVTAVFYALLWFTWKARNDKIFKVINTNFAKIDNEVIFELYSGFKYRLWNMCGR